MSIMTFKTSIVIISGSSCFTCGGGGTHMELPMLADMSNMTKSDHHNMTYVIVVIILYDVTIPKLKVVLNHYYLDSIMKKMTTTYYNSHVFNFYS